MCKNIKAFDTSNSPATEGDSKYKPDISFYDIGTGDSDSRLTSFQRMEMFVEFKYGNTSDPFHVEGKQSFEKHFETTCATRGQIALYATRLQTYQFRTWVFSIGIFGNVARLFHWDRAGAIISEPIYYTKGGNRELAEFLWRYDRLDRVQRGFDPTVFDATKEEAAAFDNAIKSAVTEGNRVLLKGLIDSVGNNVDYPRKRIDTLSEDEQVESYVVGRPIAIAGSPTGRATRGFVAMSRTGELVFLKDSWRPDIPGMMGEGHWFKRLEKSRNICALVHGSEVKCVVAEPSSTKSDPFQRTVTNVHAKHYKEHATMIGYIHYRTVQRELYVPLHMFKDSKHLVQIMLDIAKGTSLLSSASLQSLNPSQQWRICMRKESFIAISALRTS